MSVKLVLHLSILALLACGDKNTTDTIVEGDVHADDDGDGITVADGDCDDSDPNSTTTDVDADCDGILTADDCDDNDPDSTIIAEDTDCDGTLTVDDCDDNDPNSTIVAQDNDCDNVLTADDCDDNDPMSTIIAEDADCDNVLTQDDCDDNDPNSTLVAEDNDCDTILTQDDCDDNDPNSTMVIEDLDCDGTITTEDCDDYDNLSTIIAEDNDCDTVLTADDCDDNDPNSTIVAEDADCDSILTEDDCNDNDAMSTIVSEDGDCDTILTADDCDDTDPTSTIVAEDADCDTILTADDCDDNDPDSTIIANDGDCDGTITTEDCDDYDNLSTIIAEDNDCDGTLTADDCDDNDPNSTIVAEDADCDTVITINDCDDNDPVSTIIGEDADCDTILTANDCDDSDVLIGATDADGDGFIACIDDCDDNSATTYPGAAYNEADPTLCLNDADGDGYSSIHEDWQETCFAFEMTDTYGDGWNGNALEVYEDGHLTATITNQDLDGNTGCNFGACSETQTVTHCIGSNTGLVEMRFVDGLYNNEVQLQLSYADSAGNPTEFIAAGLGIGTYDFAFDGVIYTNGDVFFDNRTTYSDCDDNDANSTLTSTDADCDGIVTIDDCDDNDPGSTSITDDNDCDGILLRDDCNDNDPASTAIAEDGDCDGVLTADDCDDNDATSYTRAMDGDCDGVLTADDCNDNDSAIGATDNDGDGFIACINDCNDNDANTYPGAAYNEPDPTLCLTDFDGDGYGDSANPLGGSCFVLEMTDTYGDGWNGNAIRIYENNVLMGSFTNQSLDGNNGCAGGTCMETQSQVYCTQPDTSILDMVFIDGAYNNEVILNVYSADSAGNIDALLGAGQGAGTTDFVFQNTTYTNGQTFFNITAESGTDCDDQDISLESFLYDADCDGTVTEDDCNDNDILSTIVAEDGDCDTILTADDCDDNDPNSTIVAEDADCDGALTADDCNDNNPLVIAMLDDNDCDGVLNAEDCDDIDPNIGATDNDGDGYIACVDDCDDNNPNRHPYAGFNEADPSLCLTDVDGDGYGDMTATLGGVCFAIEMRDTYGDGWNGNAIRIYEDNVLMNTFANQNLDGNNGCNSGACSETQTQTFCTQPNTASVNMVFVDGSWNNEVIFHIYESDNNGNIGNVLGSGQGVDPSSVVFQGTTYNNGQIFFSPVGIGGTDCDDNNRNIGGYLLDGDCDGAVTADDCDDSNPTSNTVFTDADCDGVLTANDCNDNNPNVSSTLNDADCDGVATIDDCNDNNPNILSPINDADCDGFATNEDCDDNDSAIGATDNDGDGFIACIDDCDDNSATTYPGAGYNEAIPDLCVNDADGDGYGDYRRDIGNTCISFVMTDTYGDGWNGNAIELYEDGVLTGTYANANLDGNAGCSTGLCVEIQTVEHCMIEDTEMVELKFIDGSYNTEVQFAIYTNDGLTLLGSGNGSGSTNLIYDGTTYTNGDIFWSGTEILSGGIDCDDADANAIGDVDGDGHTYCTTDCDDGNPSVNANVDADNDGFSSCDDCNDGNAAIHPSATEVYYDGVDQNCDGASDYDQDGDGAEVMEFTDANGNTVTWTGYDCNDTSTYYRPLETERDPFACYYDFDNDGYGTTTPSATMLAAGVIAGTDCYDNSVFVYPGAAYNELDVDGDGITDCTRDADGDGYGNNAPAAAYNASAGTDCNDSDSMLSPGVDEDNDGFPTCPDSNGLVDCDDDNSYRFPGAGFNEATFVLGDYTTYACVTDADGDGYAYGAISSCYTFDLVDTYGDGWNNTSIEVYADGALVDSAFVDPNSADSGFTDINVICAPNGSAVEFVFSIGTWAQEIQGTIYADDGVTVIGTFTGSGTTGATQTLHYSDGISYTDGQIFFSETANGTTLVGGTDADDGDATVQ